MEQKLVELQQRLKSLMQELQNFQENAKYVIPSPGEMPELEGIQVYGESLPLKGVVGGDHIIYVDFKKRYNLDLRISKAAASGQEQVLRNLNLCKRRAGILLSDVSGHNVTDALLNAMLHQAFLVGVNYELEMFGEVTTKLFEILNTRVYNSSSIEKYITIIYGEISESGIFRFVSAGHPVPVIFSSRFDRLVDISRDRLTTFLPIGFMPSEKDVDATQLHSPLGYKEEYQVNELNLMGSGDILLLYSDGLSQHHNEVVQYFPRRLEEKIRLVKHLSAHEIFEEIMNDVLEFAPPTDDIAFVIIKKL